MWRSLLLAILFVLPLATGLPAATITRSSDFDRWMYPFNGSPGFRASAPVFGAIGEVDENLNPIFDNFDGQFLLGFNTQSSGVPTGLSPSAYQITSVKVTATHTAGNFTYDPTFDSYASHLPVDHPDYVVDADSGRPIEIYGAGVRSPYQRLAFGATTPGGILFEEGDIFAFGDPTAVNVRNAFAYDPTYGNVSNVVRDGLLDASPWAVGTTTGVNSGDPVAEGIPGVSAGSTFTFDIDLTKPGVLGYLQSGLANGGVFFSIVSLYSTEQGGSANPNFYTRDSFDPAKIAPTISIEYTIVPEPASIVSGVIGFLAIVAMAWRRGKRRQAGTSL